MKIRAMKVAALMMSVLFIAACGAEDTQISPQTGLRAALETGASTDECLDLCTAKGESAEDCSMWCDDAGWEDKVVSDEEKESCYEACIDKGESEDVCDAFCYADKECEWGDKGDWEDKEEWEDKEDSSEP